MIIPLPDTLIALKLLRARLFVGFMTGSQKLANLFSITLFGQFSKKKRKKEKGQVTQINKT